MLLLGSSMKLDFIALLLLTLLVSSCLATTDRSIHIYERVIFYYEILHRVEQPLAFENWMRQGESLVLDKAYYTEWTEPMERFYQASVKGMLLTKDVFFGILIKSHQLQSLGLYDFLTKPIAWEYFLQNACWARQQTHPHMFVYAFTRAILAQESQNDLFPFIYEILPRHFYDWRFVKAATEFSPYNWTEVKPYTILKKDSMYSWKPWQWWKMLGLNEQCWYEEQNDGINRSSCWWRPNDYTRNLPNHREQHSVLSYLTEDADWNAFWHLISVNYSPFFIGDDLNTISWKRVLYAEHWTFMLENFLRRYYLERLSHGFGEIPDFKWNEVYKDRFDPALIAINNKRFVGWLPNNNTNQLKQVRETLEYIKAIIDAGSFTLRNETEINLRDDHAFSYIIELLRGHTDPNGNFIESHWYALAHMHFAQQNEEESELKRTPHIMLNFETMARDPFFYVFHKEFVKLHQRFQSYLSPYTAADLHNAFIKIIDVNISKLVTYDDVFDFDVTNLLRSNLTFQNEHLRDSHNLFARRVRLNHRPFELNVTLDTDQYREILLRFYLGPKFDEYGRVYYSLEQNRNNFIELTNIKSSLNPGINTLHFSYEDIFIQRSKNNYFQSRIYQCAILRNCFAEKTNKNCGLHERLLLPHGWRNGLPLQLFVMAIESDEVAVAQLWWRPCIIRVGKHSLGYPFDRKIPKEQDFFGPNMLIKDVKIFHEHFKWTIQNERIFPKKKKITNKNPLY